MRTLFKMTVMFSALVLLSVQAAGQEGKRPRAGGFNNAARLVQNESVQKELKLSDEQVEKAKKVATDVLDKFKDDFSKLKGASAEERAESNKKVSDEALKSLGDVLKADQTKRLKQIELQQRGIGDPFVQKDLKLSDEQKDKVKKISEDVAEKRREIFKDAKGDFKGAMEKMTALNKETNEKYQGVLSDEQKKQWKELTGDPFEVKFEPRRKE